MRAPVGYLAFLLWLAIFPAAAHATWPRDGAAVSTAANIQERPTIVSDGAGGAIVTWADFRSGSYDVYVQRVNAWGVSQWTANGVALSIVVNQQQFPTIVADGAGGAIVTWQDNRGGASNDIYAQRVNASGVPQWTADGVALCTAAGGQIAPTIVSDGAGGAIVTWDDFRNGADYDVYVRRVNASGVPQWTADGVALSTAANNQLLTEIVSDGAGGAIVTWSDQRGGTNDVYAQRVNASGGTQWTANGVAISTAAGHQEFPTIVSDGAGGAIVTWMDSRTGPYDIYVQLVSALGFPQWTANGVALCTAANLQSNPTIASDGVGGAFVTWHDYRTGAADIYARRVNASGVAQWAADGVALCTVAGDQLFPTIVSDGVGGAIVTWYDYRNGSPDIYAQRVERNGHWGFPSPEIVGARDVPGDQGGVVNLSWDASRLDPWPDELIDNYTVWRAIDPTAAAAALSAGATSMRDGVDPLPASKVGLIRIQQIGAATYYWKLISTVQAYHLQGYSEPVPTLFDSTGASSEYHYFQVMAHDGGAYWASAPDSGRSVDNIPPAAPLTLTAQRVGADVHLFWNRNTEPDLRDYAAYRHTVSGVTPTPMFFLSSADDTVLVDANAPVNALYYIVTAVDVHENQGPPSNEASVSGPTGVGHTPRITTLTLLPNHPNPFTGTTQMEIGLPGPSDVTITVYDVTGRRVSAISIKGVEAGWRRVPFDGRDDRGRALASGVYFYKVRASGTTVTRKMVITR